jgi:hypothetical protein
MRPSGQIRHYQRLAIFKFFVIIILMLVSRSDLLSQQVKNFQLGEGQKVTWSFSITNKTCADKPHLFRIRNEYNYISFAEPTNSILIGVGSSKRLEATVNTRGLESRIYSGRIVVECLDCNNGCRLTSGNVFPFELTVTKPRINLMPTETPPTPTPTPTTPTPKPIWTITPTPTPPPVILSATITPTPARMQNLTETPAETPPSAMSPVETPPATSPMEMPTAAVSPTPKIAGILETPTPRSPVMRDYLNYLALISFVVSTLALTSLGSKKLFDKWKYGNNALQNLGSLKKAIHIKEELAQKWMRKRKTQNLHAIGIGKVGETGGFCIQLFVENANGVMPENPPIHLLPKKYQKFPFVIYEMPRAEFLAGSEDYGTRMREPHDLIIGGISGANTNLANEYGTIGYFCAPTILKPIRKFRKEVYLLSNSHVFANLSNPECANDLIQQPSPGENKRHNFIASLENYVPILFDNDTGNPNYIDAAIAKMHQGKQHKLEIPVIGKINDFVPKEKIEIMQPCRKFGRTTGYTEGKVFSIHLSIWIRYAATGQESFFKEQFLIVPNESTGDFVKGGDSGSLVADYENKAVGLIFAGANSNRKFVIENMSDIDIENMLASVGTEKIRSFGVANPISEVLKGLNVKLML